MELEVLKNPNASSPSRAVIPSAHFLDNKGAKALPNGSRGPHVSKPLEAADIEIFIKVSDLIKGAIPKLNRSQLISAPEPKGNEPSLESWPNYGFGGERRSGFTQGWVAAGKRNGPWNGIWFSPAR